MSVLPSSQRIEACREFWANIAREHNWYKEPFYVQVWYDADGEITDNVSHRNLDTNFNVLGGIPSFENAQLFFANILGIIAGLGGSAHCQTTLVLWHGGFHWPGRIYGDHGVLRNNARC